MEEPEIATKALENDATQQSPENSGQEPVQNGRSIGEHCTSDRPILSGALPGGEITKINDVDVYISKPSDYPHMPSKLLLFLSGGTGLHSVNNQLQADKFAKEGFLVIMPDMFERDPAPNSSANIEESSPSILDRIRMHAAETAKSFMIDMWLARHTPAKVLPILYKVLKGAREEFADAIAGGSGIYGVGYCIGAKYILQLASEKPDTTMAGQKVADEESGVGKRGPFIKCGAVAHGTLVTREDFEGLKSPMLLVCIQDDQLFPEEVRIAGAETLKSNHTEHRFEVYPGVPHGFAVVGEYESSEIKAAQVQAFSQMLDWLKSH